MIKRLLYLRNTFASLAVLLVLLVSSNGFGQTTVNYSFTGGSTSGSLDSNIEFVAIQNGSGTAPTVLSNQLRLYQHATKGGSIKITAKNGVTITQVVMNVATTGDGKGPRGYSVDNTTEAGTFAQATNPNTMNVTATNFVEYYSKGTSSSTRTYVNSFSVTYTMPVTNPCSGTPNASTVSLTPASGSPSTDYVVSATGYSTDATGLSYQWQYNINGGGWSNTTPENIPSSTTYSNYNATNNVFAPAIGQSVQWRLVTTCASSSLSNTSNIATFTSTLNYCTPAFSNNTDYIVNFGLESITNNNSGFSSGGYGNYTNLSTNLVENTNYTASLTSSAGSGNHGVSIWIDFNNNGTFETGERVGSLGNIVGPNQSPTIPITIPSGNLGTHRMRVIYQYNVAGTSIDPCVSAAYGEVEDYTINVIAACEAPTVTLQDPAVTAIATTTASLHGNVTDEGDFTINTRGFEYSVNSTMSAAATKSSAATATGNYSENLTGLTPNTVYYFRALAINDCSPNKTGYSHTSGYPTFTTLHNAPTIGTGSGATSSTFTAQWSAPGSGGPAAFTYEIQVDDDSNFGSVNFTANGITGISTLVNSGLTASTTYYYRVRAVNAGGNSAWSAASVGYATTAPAPEIKIKAGSSYLGYGINLSFGSQISGTTGSENTLIIENSGDAPLSVGALSISGTDAASFIITQPLSATVAAGGTTTFTVTFAPTTMGSKTAQLSLINGDADENPFLINLFGTGTANAISDIITDNTFTYTSNIDYKNYITTDITTANSVELGRFIIRDGGTGDADNVGTTLTNLGITVGNFANLERLAIYDGATEIAEMPATETTYFSGLSLFATDNGTKTFTVRGSFKQTVTDKQRITLTLASTTASSTGSEFTTINATTSTIGNDNTISVTADRLAFTTQPTNVGINTAMANVVVAAVDINNNKDADATGDISITSTGTMPVTPLTATLVNGAATFNNIVHSVAQTGRNLIAKKTGFTDLNSNLFNITEITYSIEDYRTISGGTWSTQTNGTATWEKWNGVEWVNSSRPTQNTNNVYIRHTITSNGSSTVAKIIVEGPNATDATPGGIYTITSGTTTINNHLLIEKDGIMNANNTISVSGIFEIKNDGEFNLNFVANNNSTLWNATEIFHPDSNFIIKEWDVNNSNNSYRTLVNGLKINTNTYDGYSAIFGNLIIDLSNSTQASGSFVILDGDISINLTHGDLHLLQPHPSNNINIKGTGALTTSGVGGNFIVDDAFNTSRKVLIATTGALDFTVKGNMQLDGATTNITSSTSSTNFNITIKGDLNITPSAVLDFVASSTSNPIINLNLEGNLNGTGSGLLRGQSNGNNFNFNFTGSYESSNPLTIQKIDIASTSTSENNRLNFNIKSGAYVQLVNRNFELGQNSKLTVENGGTFDFGFTENNALQVAISGSQTGTTFESQANSILKITSPEGIASSGATGNVQTTTRNFGAADYQYTGIDNQFTGTGLPTSGAKITIANTGTAPDNEVRLTNESTSVSALEITNGVFNLNEKTLTGTNLSIAENATLKIVGTQSFPSFTNKTFHNNGIVEYGGSNQSIAALTSPTYTKLKVSGSGKKVLSGTSVEVGNNLNITSSLLEISEGQTLRVHNEISTVDTDATNGLFIKNGGSLVQIANVDNQSSNINVGNIKMERITTPMNKYDYTYWSSPVAGVTLNALSPDTHPNRYYSYNAVTGAWSVITGGFGTMSEGKGYIIRAPNNYLADSYQNYTGNFTGKTHNGLVTPTINGPDKWNLLGNPYPSAVDADLFLEENEAKLGGTLYFWTHNSPFTSNGYAYSSGDYASWNGVGGTNTTAAGNTGNGINTAPAGKIAAGQGFFVQGLVNGTAEFNNTMRIAGENSQFFRSTTSAEKHRIWLNLQGGTDGFSQTLVGYVTNATNGIDHRFDGTSFGGNSVTFYSVMENKNWTIQGRALPFTTADEVPLGYKTTLTGTLIINIDDRDGQLATQNIYLKDNLLNVVHNLTDGPYNFTSTPGTYDDRFVLRYLPGQDLDNPTFEDQMNGLTIRKNNADIHINSSFENIDAVLIYDIMGRLLFEKEKCNTQTFKTSNVTQSEQMLIIKVRLNNGAVVTKKVW